MAKISFQRSIRFTKAEWDAVVEAAEKAGLTPSSFVRRAAARAAADDLRLDGGGLTPELAELVKRTFRGVHLLTYLKREELDASGKGTLFDRAAEDARTAQAKALETESSTLDRS
ncbi:MAG: hypothetical protein F4Z55_05420 [Boseongicola sp. SB0667_bin_21]|nr:hypothetical protein [Boseongicola sp. SB0667_bin_21]